MYTADEILNLHNYSTFSASLPLHTMLNYSTNCCISHCITGSLTPSTEVDAFLRQTSVTRSTKRSLLPARRLMSCDQRVFRMAKGVSSADYCSRHNVLVTGSADRLVRVWNPFMTSSVDLTVLLSYWPP